MASPTTAGVNIERIDMDWLQERFGENSTWLAIALIVFVWSQVSGTEPGDLLSYLEAAFTDLGVIAATLAGGWAGLRKG